MTGQELSRVPEESAADAEAAVLAMVAKGRVLLGWILGILMAVAVLSIAVEATGHPVRWWAVAAFWGLLGLGVTGYIGHIVVTVLVLAKARDGSR